MLICKDDEFWVSGESKVSSRVVECGRITEEALLEWKDLVIQMVELSRLSIRFCVSRQNLG